ncbi:putative importin-7 isoform X2 [Apostichopus japonicus]|uniref:Putative importin-7 isoform X2 n=1 Tax=Stichopus japonicus TaxID=307972 RepID=A0A2G8KWC6_STIJA|nr:putative importin-7 isoform X2 [Apostichopus japonicus]
MDPQKLVEMLQGTIHPETRELAEKQLNEVHKIIEFSPTLLFTVMDEKYPFPVRQAGVIYLKNMVMQFWQQREPESPIEQAPFCIHEKDKMFIRESIIKAMINCPELIRVQLGVCLSTILKNDYPGKWDYVIEVMVQYLAMDDASVWYGALVAVYQLIKNYEYKKPEEREPLDKAMTVLLPLMYQRIFQLLPDASEPSVLLQKLILKCFHALVQFHLSLNILNKDVFSQWMTVFQIIADREVPPHINELDIDDRPEAAWWKVKKWALHILSRLFDRYGNPGSVVKHYVQFSDWYLKTFSDVILKTLLKILDQFRQNQYVSPRVLQQALNYVNTGSWKIMKPHMEAIVQGVLFPLMCYTDEDDALWNDDPYEYIKLKFDVFEDFISPVTAAQTVLHTSCKKRKEILPKTMAFCMQILQTPNVNPRQKDGSFHMIGTLAEILLKKKLYKDKMELMLVTHVFPEFQNSLGYMRARANWVLHTFSETKFKQDQNLFAALNMTRECLIGDKELPVRVEAAFALHALISDSEKAKEYVQPHVKDILQALLVVIRETENDDLTNVMQKLIHTYEEMVAPIAVEITKHLAETFTQVVDSDDGADDKAMTAMGILNTIETLLMVVEDHKEIVLQLEGITLQVVAAVLQNHCLDFYEEVLSLIFSMTCTHISPPLWQVFQMLYATFEEDGFDYFIEMMPALHNFVTVDPPAFMANPKNFEVIFNMCKQILASEADEDCQCHAAKLLEVIVLQFKGQINSIIPSIVEIVLARLTREVKNTELRQMCLQVIIAVLYTDPVNLIQLLNTMKIPQTDEPITKQFVQQWLHDTDCFLGLHDRKMCVFGLCRLMTLPEKPEVVSEHSKQLIPALLLLFTGLKRAYEFRASNEEEDDDSDEDDDEDDVDVLESDESDVEDQAADYLAQLEKFAKDVDDEDDDEYEAYEETALEGFNTIIDEDEYIEDEYVTFKHTLQTLQSAEPQWYQALTEHLSLEQQKEVQEVIVMADQRKAVAESKMIEKAGGYNFQTTSVPQTFNFGAPF